MAKKVRLGLIGAGGIALHHLFSFKEAPNAKVVALADPNESCSASFKGLSSRFGKPDPNWDPTFAENIQFAKDLVREARFYTDYRAMLRQEQLDGVLINSPHALHYEQIMACLAHGAHVMCEKPFVCRAEEARKVIASARRRKRILTIAYQRHVTPQFLYARDVIASGGLGRVTFVSVLLYQNWLTLTANSWRQNPKLSGGGQINDSGSHIMDMLLFMTNRKPTEVFCHQDFRGAKVDINSSVSVRFGRDLIANIDIVGDTPIKWMEEWTLNGTEGAILMRDGKLTRVDKDWKQAPVELPPARGGLVKAFVDAILGKRKPAVDPVWGLRVIQLTEAAWKSARTGKPQKISSWAPVKRGQ